MISQRRLRANWAGSAVGSPFVRPWPAVISGEEGGKNAGVCRFSGENISSASQTGRQVNGGYKVGLPCGGPLTLEGV